MKKILKISASINGDLSFSNKLAELIIGKLRVKYTDIQLKTIDLANEVMPHLSEKAVKALYTPEHLRTENEKDLIRLSDLLIKDLMEADIVVMGVPMYNFAIPSSLKSWLDHVVRRGVTFKYNENGQPVGMLQNKKIYLAVSTGGVYSNGLRKDFDFTEPYLKTLLNFIGISDITTFRIEGTAMEGFKETALEKSGEIVEQFVF